MKRILILLAAWALLPGAAPAREPGEPYALKIWDNASAPHSNGIDAPETESANGTLKNTSEAVLYVFPADPAKDTGQAVVICPGGGYGRVTLRQKGFETAKWLAAHGITAAALKYRLPNGHPEVPLEDVERALRIMTGLEAGATGFTADRVGIISFSAGGHLAAMASTLSATKPAFAILFYPVVTGEPDACHKGSFDNLLGRERTSERTAHYSLEHRVADGTPPTLLLLSDDDRAVPPANGIRYYDALKAHGIPASMHIFPSGGHGWNFQEAFPYKAQWQEAVLDWIRIHNPQTYPKP